MATLCSVHSYPVWSGTSTATTVPATSPELEHAKRERAKAAAQELQTPPCRIRKDEDATGSRPELKKHVQSKRVLEEEPSKSKKVVKTACKAKAKACPATKVEKAPSAGDVGAITSNGAAAVGVKRSGSSEAEHSSVAMALKESLGRGLTHDVGTPSATTTPKVAVDKNNGNTDKIKKPKAKASKEKTTNESKVSSKGNGGGKTDTHKGNTSGKMRPHDEDDNKSDDKEMHDSASEGQDASEDDDPQDDDAAIEKARLQRENHARYMRFSRSLKSSLDASHQRNR